MIRKIQLLGLCMLCMLNGFSLQAIAAKQIEEKFTNFEQRILFTDILANKEESEDTIGLLSLSQANTQAFEDNSKLESENKKKRSIKKSKQVTLLNTNSETRTVNLKIKHKGKVEKFVGLTESDFLELRESARVGLSLRQRIQSIEKAFDTLSTIVKAINKTIDLVKKILGIVDEVLGGEEDSNGSFEHITGVVMNPGSISFKAISTDARSFKEMSTNELEMDVFFNKKLFQIDHIEGSGVNGDDFIDVSLPKSTRSQKTRISLPISDVLANEVQFSIFLAPVDPRSIKKGDRTKMELGYFKRIPRDENGDPGEAPIRFELASERDFIEVVEAK